MATPWLSSLPREASLGIFILHILAPGSLTSPAPAPQSPSNLQMFPFSLPSPPATCQHLSTPLLLNVPTTFPANVQRFILLLLLQGAAERQKPHIGTNPEIFDFQCVDYTQQPIKLTPGRSFSAPPLRLLQTSTHCQKPLLHPCLLQPWPPAPPHKMKILSHLKPFNAFPWMVVMPLNFR